VKGDPSGVKLDRMPLGCSVLEGDSSAQVDDRGSAREFDLAARASGRAGEAPRPPDDRVAQVEREGVAVRGLRRCVIWVARRLEIRRRLVHHDRGAVGERERAHVAAGPARSENDHILRLAQPRDLATATGRAWCAAERRVDWPTKRLREGRLPGNRGARARDARACKCDDESDSKESEKSSHRRSSPLSSRASPPTRR